MITWSTDRFGDWQPRQRDALAGEGSLVAALDFFVDLSSMYWHVGGGFDADFYHVAIQPNDLHVDPSVYDDAFTKFAGEN